MLTEKVRTSWLMIILIIMHLYILHLSLFKPSGELTLEEFIEGAKDHPDYYGYAEETDGPHSSPGHYCWRATETKQCELGWINSILRTEKPENSLSEKQMNSEFGIPTLEEQMQLPTTPVWFPQQKILRGT